MTMKIMVTLGYSHEQKVAWKQKTELLLKAVTYQSRLFSGRRKDVPLGSYLEQLHCVQNGLRTSLYIYRPVPVAARSKAWV